MPVFYSSQWADTRPPRSIFTRGIPNWYPNNRVSGDEKNADKSFSFGLEARGFYINRDDYSWRGPNGQVFSTEFVEAMDRNYSWETCANVLRAIDMGAKTVNLRWNQKARKYRVEPSYVG